ncbi:MAG: 4Fe-4S binding protein, partial [Fidelibacterota bacterium]
YVDVEKCNSCGLCWNSCPAVRVPSKRVVKMHDKIIKRAY